MNQFSIRDVEMLSGIKAHTLRIWEQRDGFNFCKRKESQHRYYDNDDLKQILQISFLYHHGYKISKIAKLSASEISDIAPSSFLPAANPAVDKLIQACTDYNEEVFSDELERSIQTYGLEDSLIRTIYPVLEEIGMLWMNDKMLPAQEHFATAIIQNKILAHTNALPAVSEDGHALALIFSPAGEMHEIPLLIARYILKKHGVRTVYLGASIGVEEVRYFCEQKKVTHLYFNLTTNFPFFEPVEYLDLLRKAVPNVQIIASGPVMNQLRDVPENVTIVSSLEEITRLQQIVSAA